MGYLELQGRILAISIFPMYVALMNMRAFVFLFSCILCHIPASNATGAYVMTPAIVSHGWSKASRIPTNCMELPISPAPPITILRET